MTTIVYREGYMAGDTRAYRGYDVELGNKQKVFKIHNELVGISTNIVGLSNLILNYLSENNQKPLREVIGTSIEIDHLAVLAVNEKGIARFMSHDLLWTEITGEYFVVGSGEKYALGALCLGASAREAVEVASRFDQHTNNIIDVISH